MSRITCLTCQKFWPWNFFDKYHVCFLGGLYTPAQVKLHSFTKKFKSWLLLSGAELGSSQTRINGDIWEICNLVVLELVGIWVHFFRLLPVILERWSKYDSKSYCTPSCIFFYSMIIYLVISAFYVMLCTFHLRFLIFNRFQCCFRPLKSVSQVEFNL